MTQFLPLSYLPELLGVAGFFTYATADILLSLRRINSDGCTYYVLCGTAAILLTGGLLFNFNLGAFLTEIFCLATCTLAIALRLKTRRKPKAGLPRANSNPAYHDRQRPRPSSRRKRTRSGLPYLAASH